MKTLISISYILVVLSLIIGAALSLPSPQQTQQGKRLIKFSENEPGQWMTQAEIEVAASKALNFMDVTGHKDSKSIHTLKQIIELPKAINFNATVRAAIALLDVNRIEQFMVPFTSFHNRYYTSESGIAASNWLYMQIYNFIASVPGYQGTVSLEQFEHADWPQKSIIVRIAGSEPTTVVLGAHLDSVTQGTDALAPGADDNASGSTTIFEALKTLLLSGFVPKNTLEFHWYAAEEVGLRGAQDIAEKYDTESTPIMAMLNFDMSGYTSPNDTRIAIIGDFTDPELNAYVKELVDAYNSVGWMDRTCGYGCSDHAAWNRLGYKSSFAHESTGNSFAHTVNDTVQNLDYGRIFEYSKLAIAFAIELAEPRV